MTRLERMWKRGTLVGKRVRIGRYVRTVEGLLDVPGGVRLDRPIEDMRFWNIDAIKLYRRRSNG